MMMNEAEIAEEAQRFVDAHGDQAGRKAAYNELIKKAPELEAYIVIGDAEPE